MNNDIEIRRAEEKDIPKICQMAVDRMVGAVEASYSLNNISEKEKLLTQFFISQLEHIYRIGEIFIAGDYQGLFAGYNGKNTSLLSLLQLGVAMNKRVGKFISKADIKQMKLNTKNLSGANNSRWQKKTCGNSNYYYIQLIAIDNSLKGCGVFRKLLDPVLLSCEQNNIPVLVDTHDKDNLPIYQHFGFELVAEHHSKIDSSIIQYSMIRYAAQPRRFR